MQYTATTQHVTLSRGARLYIPLAWQALQSLNLLLPIATDGRDGAWLRMTQSAEIITIPRFELLVKARSLQRANGTLRLSGLPRTI